MENQENKLTIKRIKDIYFYVNEKPFVPDSKKPVKFQIQNAIEANIDKNLVGFTVRIFLHYEEYSNVNNLLADIKVQTVFEIKDLKKYASKIGISFPPELLVTLLGMSIDHGRDLWAKNLAGTAYQEVYLPIINPLTIARHLYPIVFAETSK